MFNWFKKKEEVKPIYVTGCEFHCTKKNCPKWVIMYQKVEQKDGTFKTVEDGRCFAAWLPILLVELREKIGVINGNKEKPNSTDTNSGA